MPSPRWWKRFSRRSSVRSDPVEPAPLLSPFGTTALALWHHALTLWHRGGASRSRSFPGSVGAVLSVLPTRASRARWPPFWMRGPGAGCRCGRGLRCHHGDLEPAGADGRPHPQRHLLLGSVQHRHLGFLGDGRGRGRLLVRLRPARIGDAECADRREKATGHKDASGRAGRCSKHGILTSRRVRYMHALSVLLV